MGLKNEIRFDPEIFLWLPLYLPLNFLGVDF